MIINIIIITIDNRVTLYYFAFYVTVQSEP